MGELVVSEELGEAPVRPGADAAAPAAGDRRVFAHERANRDMVSIDMFKVYERYSKEPQSLRHGNTVRSLKAVPGEWPQEFTFDQVSSHCFYPVEKKSYFPADDSMLVGSKLMFQTSVNCLI